MLIDGDTIRSGSLEADTCVIGAGPAGIILARELARQGMSVALIESGGELPDGQAQAPNRGQSIGYPYFPLEVPRTRTFGGIH